MFDNIFVFLSAITDAEKNPVMDNNENPIESRTYSDLLAKFMEGIPKEFQVSGYLRDNARRGLYSVLDSVEDAVKDSESRGLNGRSYFKLNKFLTAGTTRFSVRLYLLEIKRKAD